MKDTPVVKSQRNKHIFETVRGIKMTEEER